MLLSENAMSIVLRVHACLLLSGLVSSIWMVFSLVRKLRQSKASTQDPIVYKMLLLIALSDTLGAGTGLILCMMIIGFVDIQVTDSGTLVQRIANVISDLPFMAIVCTSLTEALLVYQVYEKITHVEGRRVKLHLFGLLLFLFFVTRIGFALFSESIDKPADTIETRTLVDHVYAFFALAVWVYFFIMFLVFWHKMRHGYIVRRLQHLVKRVSFLMVILIGCFFGLAVLPVFYLYIFPTKEPLPQNHVLLVLSTTTGTCFYVLNVLAYGASQSCCSCKKRKQPQAQSLLVHKFIRPSDVEIDEEEVLGSGAMGTVLKGIYRGTEVAIKRLHLPQPDSPSRDTGPLSTREHLSFLAEVAMLNRLIHPNIIYYMGAFIKDNNGFIICEYCNSGSLRDVLLSFASRKQACDFAWTRKIALGMAYGLKYLHEMDLVHRDLKSPNVLVVDNAIAKVADFGTAKLLSSLVQFKPIAMNHYSEEASLHTIQIGTIRWSAPETLLNQFNDKGQYNTAIDVYSFGLILWELISHDIPFADIRFNYEIEDLVIKGNRPPLPTNAHDIPIEYIHLMDSCWSGDPQDRPDMGQVIETLQNLSNENY